MREPEGSVCGSASMPPSALRKGKFTASAGASEPKPQPLDLSLIHDVFGVNATLYHVLRIKPWAEASEVRRAYLSQGRETLLNGGLAVNPGGTPRNLDDVPESARKKFQAISIAYEILSTPEWRSCYDRYGVVYAQALPPQLNRETIGHSVRWKPYVEEKVIKDAHPNEHSRHDEREDEQHHRAESRDARKKHGQGVGWVEAHLRKIDQEAEKFFLDGGLQQSIGSLLQQKGKKPKGATDDSVLSEIDAAIDSALSNDAMADPTEVESKPKKSFLPKIKPKRIGLFRKEAQIASEPYEESRDDNGVDMKVTSITHSPCSVMGLGQCFNDPSNDDFRLCGLSHALCAILPQEDDFESVY